MKHSLLRFLLIFPMLSSLALLAQDIHFSYYQAVPLLQNPAFAGSCDGDFQLAAIHRNQWNALGDPFVTTGASFDHKLFVLPMDWGIGVTAVNDQSGVLGLTQNKVMVSSGMHFKTGRDKLGVGFQTGITWKSYGLDGITYPGQFNRDIGLFDSTLPSGETGVSDQLSFLDMNLGMLYQMPRGWGKMLFGAAVHHLNGPKESFLNRDERLRPRLVTEARSEVNLPNGQFLMPSLYWQQHNKAQEIIPGIGWGKRLSENSMKLQRFFLNAAVRTGINRNGDAVLLSGGLDFKQLSCVLTYDYNYSDFSVATQGNGGVEITLIFTGLSSEIKDKILPCDRY